MEILAVNTDEVRRLASHFERYSQALASSGEAPRAAAGFGTGAAGEQAAHAYRSTRSAVEECRQQLTEAIARHAGGLLAAAATMDEADEEAQSRATTW